MSWSIVLCATTCLIAADAGGDKAENSAAEPGAGAQRQVDTVYFAPAGPYFARWTIRQAKEKGKPVESSRWSPLFRLLDVDGNEGLDAAEFARVPWAQWNDSLAFSATVPISSVDQPPFDKAVTLAELAAYLDHHVPPLRITYEDLSTAASAQSGFELFRARLDPTRPDGIAVEALKDATGLLDWFDYSNDDAIGREELATSSSPAGPARHPAAYRQARAPIGSPVVILGAKGERGEIIRRLIARYDRVATGANPRRGRDGLLNADELDLPSDVVARFDADKGGGLDSGELDDLLGDPPVHDRVGVWYDSGAVSLTQTGAGTVHLKTAVDISDRPRSLPFLRNPQALSWLFKRRDANKNGYLEIGELGSGPESQALFRAADIDGDKKLFPEEWERYAALQLAAAGLVVKLEIVELGPSLFELLDENGDQRLSLRELMGAAQLAAREDKNQDGVLSSDELAARQEWNVGSGDVRLPVDVLAEPVPLSTSSGISSRSGTSGSTWFAAMDTNGDGDVSPREFLGPTAHFRRLDANSDGLIDSKEADTGSARLKPE